MPFQKYMSIQQQKIIHNAYKNGNKINYKEQTIFRNERSFFASMLILCMAKIFYKSKGGYHANYYLLPKGKASCRLKLIPLIKKCGSELEFERSPSRKTLRGV